MARRFHCFCCEILAQLDLPDGLFVGDTSIVLESCPVCRQVSTLLSLGREWLYASFSSSSIHTEVDPFMEAVASVA